MKISAQDLISQALEGKVLRKLSYADEGDERTKKYGRKILKVRLGPNESHEDAGIWLTIEEDEEGWNDPIFVYDLEEIEVE